MVNGVVIGSETAATLADRMRLGIEITEVELIELLRELLDAIAFAHAQGVVHRDLKPDNILLSPSGPLIGDFGLVGVADADWLKGRLQNSVGQSAAGVSLEGADGALLGTYAYMDAQQRKGEPADQRSDLYSLGLIAFQLLTGKDRPGLKAASRLRAGIQTWWDEWFERALEDERDERFQTAEEMLQQLAPGAPLAAGELLTNPSDPRSQSEELEGAQLQENGQGEFPHTIEFRREPEDERESKPVEEWRHGSDDAPIEEAEAETEWDPSPDDQEEEEHDATNETLPAATKAQSASSTRKLSGSERIRVLLTRGTALVLFYLIGAELAGRWVNWDQPPWILRIVPELLAGSVAAGWGYHLRWLSGVIVFLWVSFLVPEFFGIWTDLTDFVISMFVVAIFLLTPFALWLYLFSYSLDEVEIKQTIAALFAWCLLMPILFGKRKIIEEAVKK